MVYDSLRRLQNGDRNHFLLNLDAAGSQIDQYKIMQKTLKMTETLAIGYSSGSARRELSNEYQHDRV